MNRNVESHFSEIPQIDIERSIFDRSSEHMTTFNVGDLIPIYVDEVLPGDTFQMDLSSVVRLQTLLTPTFSNLYLDVRAFYAPMYLLWNHAKEFFGENNTSPWVPSVTYQIPSISAPSGGFATGTIADYLGLPVGVNWSNTAERRPSALPFRMYAQIADQYYRDENLSDPLNIPLGDSNQTGTNGSSYINDVANGGQPFKVAKFHDYFTSALPSPQKAAQPVTLPLISGDLAPVGTVGNSQVRASTKVGTAHLEWSKSGTNTLYTPAANHVIGINTTGNTFDGATAPGNASNSIHPYNLMADLSTTVGAVSINELRLAFQLQRYYERNARGGTRYTELLRSHFGVTAPDSVLHRVEYIGGTRIPIQINEVINQAQTATDFLGDVGAMSVTSDINSLFTHSFTSHGYLMIVACVRYDHSYPQGLEKFWSRRDPTSFYWPVFANLGEQPVYDSEIYADANSMSNSSVFGYQEAWADYRYKPDRVSGELRPGIPNTLASWHFADYYTSAPVLSDSWIREDKSNVDRTLAVTSVNSNQVLADFYFKNLCTRPMPMYSIPGLIDHH